MQSLQFLARFSIIELDLHFVITSELIAAAASATYAFVDDQRWTKSSIKLKTVFMMKSI